MRSNVTGITLAAIAAAVMAVGCGEQKIEQASAGTESPDAVVARSVEAVVPDAQAATATESLAPAQADSLPPPEVAATLSDTLVSAGGIVEITAEASEDVVEVSLRDDLGRKQPFVYDAERELWRTTYRVPMRLATERLGLSVTARNDAHRWRRVWLFVGIGGEPSPGQP